MKGFLIKISVPKKLSQRLEKYRLEDTIFEYRLQSWIEIRCRWSKFATSTQYFSRFQHDFL